MNDKPIYTIVNNHEVPELSKIEKSNMKINITLADSLSAIQYNERQMESLEAELNLKKAIITNVTVNHPEVLTIDEKMQIACHTFYETNRFIKIAEDKLAQFNKAQDDLREEVSEIEKQTGVKKMGVEEKIKLTAKINKKYAKK